MERTTKKYFLKNGEIKEEMDFYIPEEGKKLYEVIRIINGVPLFMEQHNKRLQGSLSILDLKSRYSEDIILNKIKKVIEANEFSEGNIKIILNFIGQQEDIYIYYIPHSYPEEKLYSEGVHTILFHEERQNPNAKVINSGLRERVDEKLKEEKAYEAILVDGHNRITEGSKSNIFFVKGDKLITSPLEAVLPGITREQIIELAKGNSIEVVEEFIDINTLKIYDGAFISGTSPKILPIKSINLIKFNSVCNLLVKKLMKLYDNSIEKYITEH